MNKTEVKKLLVEERKSMRAKAKQSEFMRKTLSIYAGQVKRAGDGRETLGFDLEVFREFFRKGIESGCFYTGCKLTLKTATVDHDVPIARGGTFSLNNLRVCSTSANWQKGIMTGWEFYELMLFAKGNLDPAAFDDLKRRLTTGGKWLAKRF